MSAVVFAAPIVLQPDEVDIVLVMDFTDIIPTNETIKSDPEPVLTIAGVDDDDESPVLESDFTSLAPNAQTIQRDDGTTIAIGKAVTMVKTTASGTPLKKYRIEIKVRTSTTNQLREGDGILWIVD